MKKLSYRRAHFLLLNGLDEAGVEELESAGAADGEKGVEYS